MTDLPWDFLDEVGELEEYLPPHEIETWEDKEGGVHIISEMESRHIRNCINMIKKRRTNPRRWPDGWREEFLPRLEEELRRRGESLGNRRQRRQHLQGGGPRGFEL